MADQHLHLCNCICICVFVLTYNWPNNTPGYTPCGGQERPAIHLNPFLGSIPIKCVANRNESKIVLFARFTPSCTIIFGDSSADNRPISYLSSQRCFAISGTRSVCETQPLSRERKPRGLLLLTTKRTNTVAALRFGVAAN